MDNLKLDGNFVPRKTHLGAHVVALRDDSLPQPLRRLLLLADGQRDLDTLVALMPGRDVAADLADLAARGLIQDALPIASAPPRDLPEEWMMATSFMMERARETLGVAAINVIDELEQARDTEEARQAMTSWYRAMRESRQGRLTADAARVEVTQLLNAVSTAPRPR